MTGSNKSKNTSTSSTDSLTKASSVELSETALGEASGGAIYMNSPALGSHKLDSSLKLENKASDPNLLLPAVKPLG